MAIKAEQIPVLNPLRFIKADDTLAENINTWSQDRGFFEEHRRPWQFINNYEQKRNFTDDIDIYIDTLATEVYIRLLDADGNRIATTLDAVGITGVVVPGNTYEWAGVPYNFQSIYETFRFSDIYAAMPAQQIVYIALECVYDTVGDENSRWYVSEPIFVRKSGWPKTMLIDCTHPINKFGVAFEQYASFDGGAGIHFRMRVEAALLDDPQPAFNDTAFQDQNFENRVIDSTPYDLFDFVVGVGRGVPKYELRKVNRALSCKVFLLDGVRFVKDSGAAWSSEVITNYNLYTSKIRLQEYDHDGGTLFGYSIEEAGGGRFHDDFHDDFHD